jgi:hypothetical protein
VRQARVRALLRDSTSVARRRFGVKETQIAARRKPSILGFDTRSVPVGVRGHSPAPVAEGAAPYYAGFVEKRISENSGLCVTCDNAPTCMYVGDAERPVMQCEEFSQHGAPPAGPASRHALADLPEALDEEAERFLAIGLCAKCASRATCALPRPPGGVWQCDAFR